MSDSSGGYVERISPQPPAREPVAEPSPDPVVIATYKEIAAHFGMVGPNAARTKVKRAGWPAEASNHPADALRIRVPRDAWDTEVRPRPERRGRRAPPPVRDAALQPPPPPAPLVRDAVLQAEPAADAPHFRALADAVDMLRDQLEREQKRADSAETRVTEGAERERELRDRLAAAGAELATAQAQAIAQRAARERDAAELVKVGGQLAREQIRAETAEARLDDERRRGDQAEARAGRAEERSAHLRDRLEATETALTVARAEAMLVPPVPPEVTAEEKPARTGPWRTRDSNAKVTEALAQQAQRRGWRRWLRRGRAGS